MNKINNLIMIMPIMTNMMMMMLMMTPMKMNKFHPITLIILLILLTLMISLKLNFLMKSMISFMLFLIVIGGLMVIFMYITSLANNELFTLNLKYLIINIFKILPIMMLLLMLMMMFKQLILINIIESNNLMNWIEMNYKYINIMYKEMNNKPSYFIMLYLYYSMICIMNICYKLKTPLRQILF
uniref:NADH dehydrogenase subunit 6 n=1 Tax=Amblyjoppa sp. ZJUH_2016002 TaxID=2491150 RepID=A0A3S8V0C0_9HYME|nr:NADH dehydrogenase subunit 6 [Amblyjoppa sp. ZJUH_2016002]